MLNSGNMNKANMNKAITALVAVSASLMIGGIVYCRAERHPSASHPIAINAIFSQLNPTDPLYKRFSSVLASPLIDGVSTALNWASIDKGPQSPHGQYQWSAFDGGI